MKRPEPASSRCNYGSIKKQNIEDQIKKIEKELAWMRAEQEEMTRWIDSLDLDDQYE
jgi:hypothetical protein